MILVRLLPAALALFLSFAARAEFILSMPDGAARAGAPLRVDLTILNESDAPLRVELPEQLHARLESQRSSATFDMRPERSGPAEIAPRQFLRVALQGEVPDEAVDAATLTLQGLETNR